MFFSFRWFVFLGFRIGLLGLGCWVLEGFGVGRFLARSSLRCLVFKGKGIFLGDFGACLDALSKWT